MHISVLWPGVPDHPLPRTSSYANAFDFITNGYWPLTKELLRIVFPVGRDLSTEPTTYITGHSQGGGRAELAALWLEAQDGKAYKTYSFDGVGVQCALTVCSRFSKVFLFPLLVYCFPLFPAAVLSGTNLEHSQAAVEEAIC